MKHNVLIMVRKRNSWRICRGVWCVCVWVCAQVSLATHNDGCQNIDMARWGAELAAQGVEKTKGKEESKDD